MLFFQIICYFYEYKIAAFHLNKLMLNNFPGALLIKKDRKPQINIITDKSSPYLNLNNDSFSKDDRKVRLLFWF